MNRRLALAVLLAGIGAAIASLPGFAPVQGKAFLYAGTGVYLVGAGFAVRNARQ